MATHLRVAKIFSTVDGQVQFIELEIVRAGDQPLVLAGRKLTVRDRRGRVWWLPLRETGWTLLGPGNLDENAVPGRNYLLVGTDRDDWWGSYADFWIVPESLPIDGGTITIDGEDEFDYGPLPGDGRHALARDGRIVPADFEGRVSVQMYDSRATEFYNSTLDHYFLTNRADELALLRSPAVPGWVPTGRFVTVLAHAVSATLRPACRYLLLSPGSYSHFLSITSAECGALDGQPGSVRESTSAFYAAAPVDGKCGSMTFRSVTGETWATDTLPIYRLWNGKADANHRYVMDAAERDRMIARGWILEGSGADGVAMCTVPSDTTRCRYRADASEGPECRIEP